MENRRSERINDDHREAEEDEEEKKMDEFFALLRSFRDARDRRRNELKQLQIRNNDEDSNKKKRKADHQVEQSSWIPSFEWEDFTETAGVIEFRRRTPLFIPNPNPSPSNKNRHHEKGKNNDQQCEEHGLDLKLAL